MPQYYTKHRTSTWNTKPYHGTASHCMPSHATIIIEAPHINMKKQAIATTSHHMPHYYTEKHTSTWKNKPYHGKTRHYMPQYYYEAPHINIKWQAINNMVRQVTTYRYIPRYCTEYLASIWIGKLWQLRQATICHSTTCHYTPRFPTHPHNITNRERIK